MCFNVYYNLVILEYNLINKLTLYSVFFAFFCLFIISSNESTGAGIDKLSTGTHELLRAVEAHGKNKNKLIASLQGKYFLNQNGNEFETGLLIKVGHLGDTLNLIKHGLKINTIAGNIISGTINIRSIQSLANNSSFDYLQVDEPVATLLDSARAMTSADSAFQGHNLPLRFTGKGVIIGVIDNGFDLTHPAFMDQNGNTRIKRIWIQDYTKNPPTGFTYGNELTEEIQFKSQRTDNERISHGTHVAAIAAGSSLLAQGKYRGIAPEADLVLVSNQLGKEIFFIGPSKIIDAISYIFKFAESQGKSAVINMSFGHQAGPHDGTSLFDEACENLVGPGKVLIGAAGNSGENKFHLFKNFNHKDSLLASFAFTQFFPFGDKHIELWGDSLMDFSTSISLYNSKDKIFDDSTGFININSNGFLSDTLYDIRGIRAIVDFYNKPIALNGRSNMVIKISSMSPDYYLMRIKAKSGSLHVWNVAEIHGAPFESRDFAGLVDGDNNYSISEIGGSGDAVISVAAYSTRESYFDLNNQLNSVEPKSIKGMRADFSSLGPRVDGKIKPDISAPGHSIISAINSSLGTMEEWSYCEEYRAGNYCYASGSGTSMAAPMVTGTVALLLQILPWSTPDDIRFLLQKTASKDEFTGLIPKGGNSKWGAGKLNIYKAVQSAYIASAANQVENSINNSFKVVVFPNPSDGNFNLISSEASDRITSISIYTLTGELLLTNEYNNLDLSDGLAFECGLPSGLYYLKINSGNSSTLQLLTIIK